MTANELRGDDRQCTVCHLQLHHDRVVYTKLSNIWSKIQQQSYNDDFGNTADILYCFDKVIVTVELKVIHKET